ncbi:MAG: hypothetical protein IPM96_21805 [Ignavibacteria bacterium]|nr:hypothetical protein [Ignavibacteria bacterium]
MSTLSKSEKRIARELISKGLQVEFEKALNDAYTVLQNWKNKEMNNSDAYYLLFKTVKDNDKHIAFRYHGIGGSDYIDMIFMLLLDGIVSEDDLKEFREEVRNEIMMMYRIRKG